MSMQMSAVVDALASVINKIALPVLEALFAR
jgi:hypothetical protein